MDEIISSIGNEISKEIRLKNDLVFIKNNLTFRIVAVNTGKYLPDLKMTIKDTKAHAYGINLIGASTGCGLYELSGFNSLSLYNEPLLLETLSEVLINLQYILPKARTERKFKYWGGIVFGGYIAASNADSEDQQKVLEKLGFLKIHSFLNYNENISHYQNLHFLETHIYDKFKSFDEQEIKYEVSFE